jgi:hypothetical protein
MLLPKACSTYRSLATGMPKADGKSFIDADRGTGLLEETIFERLQPH